MSGKVPKVVVTGASGLLGRAVTALLREKGYTVVGLAFSRVGPDLVKCDLTDPEAVTALLEQERPAVVVHAAAERFPDQVEKNYEKACEINVKTSAHIASVTKKIGGRVILISTDYVFDGTAPPHKVEDPVNPLGKYAQTKVEAEKAVLAADPSACVLRVPVLYGPVERLGESAVTCLLEALKGPDNKQVSHYEQRCPAHTADIAHILADMISLITEGQNLSGIYQWSGKEKMTKYEMVMTMSRVFGLPHHHITPSTTGGPLRPRDPQMDTSRLTDLGISHHTQFEEGIKDCLTPWL